MTPVSRNLGLWLLLLLFGLIFWSIVTKQQPRDTEISFTRFVQAVDDAPRYHVDIETDDLAAEVARLTALGAELVTRWKDAFTMRSPGGHLLCVVPIHSDPETFAKAARTWP